MKSKLISFCMTMLFACSTAFAQVSYTHNSTQAGQMNSATVPNYATITDLTVTGNIDARDVRFMRDSMTVLAELDLSGATVVAYSGLGGTYLTDTTYPDNEMPEYSFCTPDNYQGKTSLVSVQLPASLTSIGNLAFYGCSGLTGSLTLPAGLTSIEHNAFAHCVGLTGSLTFPSGLTHIEEGVFNGCRGLTGSLSFPVGLTFIGDGAFNNCDGLTGSLTFPSGLTSIGRWAFYGCSSLTGSLSFPAGLTSIGQYAFYGCNGFTNITNFNPTPVSIASNVFSMDKSTCTLTVPTSSVNLYKNADVWKDFPNTVGGGLSMSVKSNISTLGNVSGVENRFYAVGEQLNLTAMPAVGYGFINWTSGETVLSTNTTLNLVATKDTVIIANFGNATTINLPVAGTLKDNVSTTTTRLTVTGNIDARDVKFMRDSMTVLAELDLSGATVVAYSGLGGTYLTDTTYPDNEMPIYSFYHPSNYQSKISLVSVQLPAGLTSIGTSAFDGCYGLSGSLTFPAGLTSIGDYAFYNCSGLTGSLTFLSGLTSIGDYAFYNCSGLTGSLTFPSGLTSIGDYAFYNCSGLTGSLTLLSGLTSIGDYAFNGCSGLTGSLTLLYGLTSIGDYAFYNCSGLSGSLTLPFGLASIGERAFSGCNGFTNIINRNPEPVSITYSVFSVVRSICTLTVPACALSAYKRAITWKDFSTIIGDSSLSCSGDAGVLPNKEAPQTTSSLQVYPNPTRDKVYFSNPNGVEATLYSPQGKLLQRTHSNSVDLSSYPQGIYLLKVGILTAKVVKH